MKPEMITFFRQAWIVLRYGKRFMLWNLFLAFIPLGLSFWLFKGSRKTSALWWIVFVIFIAFLPNAPYVLTDIIHLIDIIRSGLSVWLVTLVLIPQYSLFILAGFEAYVISLMNLGSYLKQQGLKKFTWSIELTLHLLSAIGIYLGRFLRFNSWDFITSPRTLLDSIVTDVARKQPILIIVATIVILSVLYWIFKQITLGILARIQSQKFNNG